MFYLLVHRHNWGYITTSVAIVGGGPNCNEVRVLEPELETIHDKLMGSGNQIQAVDVVELWGYFRTEKPSSTSWGDCPGVNIIGVGPHEVAISSFMRDFVASVDQTNLIQGLNIGGKSSMDAENFSFNNCTSAEEIENLSAELPRVGISVLADTFIVVSIHLRNLSSFVVSSQQSNVVGPFKLEAHQKLEGLDRVKTAIDKISHENIARLGDFSSFVEKLKKIMELSVNISTNSNWCAYGLNIAFFDE
jgi:hypothetical protein